MEKATKQKQSVRTPKWDMSGAQRLAIWTRAQSVLKKKAPAMLSELKKIRQEWK